MNISFNDPGSKSIEGIKLNESSEDPNVSLEEGTVSREMGDDTSLEIMLENSIDLSEGAEGETTVSEMASKIIALKKNETPVENASPEKRSTGEKIDDAIVFSGKAAIATVGIPIAVIGKLTGGAISGAVGLTAGFAGLLGAGVGFLFSKGKKEGALSGAEIALSGTAVGVGTLLTPVNAIAKFVENFGKALIPDDVRPKVYDDFNGSFKTSIWPQEIRIGKNASTRTFTAVSDRLKRAQSSKEEKEVYAMLKEQAREIKENRKKNKPS